MEKKYCMPSVKTADIYLGDKKSLISYGYNLFINVLFSMMSNSLITIPMIKISY